jgi:hypothetical protein
VKTRKAGTRRIAVIVTDAVKEEIESESAMATATEETVETGKEAIVTSTVPTMKPVEHADLATNTSILLETVGTEERVTRTITHPVVAHRLW